MLKNVLTFLFAVVAVGAAITFLGSRLPVSHVSSRLVVVSAPIDVVFGTITDFKSQPSWRSNVKSVSVTTDSATGRQHVMEESSTGTMMMEVAQIVPPTRLVMRIVGDDLPYGGTWAYALVPQANATRVTITEYGEVYNPFLRFISKHIMGHSRTIDGYLVNLAAKFGDNVVPADAATVPP